MQTKTSRRLVAPPGYWGKQQTAAFLGISQPTLRRWTKRKLIRTVVKGDFNVYIPAEIKKFKEGLKENDYYGDIKESYIKEIEDLG